ncbi:hypothetical protein ACDY96_16515 [Rhizobium mongolense]|uniref:hypothetical protein n=1 Tax=Rhizobium mongolense TaxID=57676 RepID=UPI003555CDCB
MTSEQFSMLSEALAKEYNGQLGEALICSVRMIRRTRGHKLHEVAQANANRLILKIARRAADLLSIPQPLSETLATPLTYARDTEGEIDFAPIVSLTTISGRLDACQKTIESLLAQTLKPHSINLYISEEAHLLDEGISRHNPLLAQIAELGVNVYAVPNIGPYRKQIPVISQLRTSGASDSSCIVTVDDDVLYPPAAIERIVEQCRSRGEVAAHRGRRIHRNGERFAEYSTFDVPVSVSSLENLPNGRNGIAFLLGHVPFDAKYLVGPVIAPTADDLWLKFVTLVRCIPCAILEPTAMMDPALDYEDVFPERKEGLWRGFNANGSNDISLESLDVYFSRMLEIRPATLL